MSVPFSTPILLIVFNRPDTTARVLECLAELKPTRLFVAGDGARIGRAREAQKVAQTRELVAKAVSWPCEVKTLYRDTNLGCKMGVSSAITWFFENIEEGIILEDDCLPDVTFFGYCAELLNRYKNDERVMHIGGTNFQNGKKRGEGSYYFSKYNYIWGWATWRRAWKKYDITMPGFESFKSDGAIKNILKSSSLQKIWLKKFEEVFTDRLDTWDYQWTYTIWKNKGLCIVPNVNLVSNIGFGEDATHTKNINVVAAMPTSSLGSLAHPSVIAIDEKADVYYERSLKFFYRLINKIKAYLV